MQSWFAWVESTPLARAIAESLTLTASLSAIHVLAFTLVMGAAFVGNFTLLGWVRAMSATSEALRSCNRAIAIGLAISVTTGALLFAARATTASANGIFQLKMVLLVAAAAFQFGFVRSRIGAAASLSIWIALAITACAFILLE